MTSDISVTQICHHYDNDPALLIEILHATQKQLGWISNSNIATIAQQLNRTKAEILGTVSFYHDFERSPPTGHTIHICRAEACQATDCEKLVDHAQKKLGIELDQTGNGKLKLKSAYCLGNCALGPAMLIGQKLYGKVSAQVFDQTIADLNP